jgi:guanylate kinase
MIENIEQYGQFISLERTIELVKSTVLPNRKVPIFLITGPSGVGKSTIISELLQNDLYNIVKRHTTKNVTIAEGLTDYIETDNLTFKTSVLKNYYIEWGHYRSGYYGTTLESLVRPEVFEKELF